MKKILYTFILSLLAIYSYAQVQLYGLTCYGGTYNLGTIFHYNPTTGVKTIDQSFIYLTSGASPQYTDLTNGGNNKFYGMTRFGGSTGNGVIFEWDPTTNIYIKKIDFYGSNGSKPMGSLVLQNGKFWRLLATAC